MSVIVKGMEMPESCESCGVTCELWARHKVGQRHPDCPLRPLPNVRGDLIDRDALLSRAEWEDIYDMQNAGTIHGELWFKKVPDFLKATLLANGYKSYSELAEEEDGEGMGNRFLYLSRYGSYNGTDMNGGDTE